MPIIFETRSIVAPASVRSNLLLDTVGNGLSIVADGGSGTPDKYYQLSGTDVSTGCVFNGDTSPNLWGGIFQAQVIGDATYTADQMYTLTFETGDSNIGGAGTCIGITRNQDHLSGQAPQYAWKFLPTAGWASQGFWLGGVRFKLPSGYSTTTNHQFTLSEVKSQGGNDPYPVVHLLMSRESLPSQGGADTWCLKLGAVNINGNNDYDTWGDNATPGTPTATCTGDTDYYDGKFYRAVTALQTEKWYTVIFGFRLKDHSGNVAGNGSDGWAACWWGEPNPDGSPCAWSACSLAMLVPGRNVGFVTGPSADYVFVMNHYSNNQTVATGKKIKYTFRGDTAWWADAPSRPAECV